MPGENYFDSVVNYWRVYSSNNQASKKICENFFSKIFNIKISNDSSRVNNSM